LAKPRAPELKTSSPSFANGILASASVTKALVTLVKGEFAAEGLTRIFYFHTAQADALFHDVITDVLLPLQASGKTEVAIRDLLTPLARWVAEGKTVGRWSEPTLVRVAQGLLATLRDFGVLQGRVHKRLAPMYLPVEACAYIAFLLHQEQPSGERLLGHPEWRLFFLSSQVVERFFVEAHQHHLLEYHAAGSIIRITFPTESIEEYARALVARTP